MNRGSDAPGELASVADDASMRPRFMNRGSSVPLNPITRLTIRFNEAPIHESGKLAGVYGHPVALAALQ